MGPCAGVAVGRAGRAGRAGGRVELGQCCSEQLDGLRQVSVEERVGICFREFTDMLGLEFGGGGGDVRVGIHEGGAGSLPSGSLTVTGHDKR